jgi:ketosteroid isomerase-like protein
MSRDLFDEITMANRRLMQSLLRGDAAAVAQHYTEDARLMVPHADPIEGRPALEAVFRKTLSLGHVYEFKTVELHGDDRAAYEIGEYRRTSDAGRLLDRGKYIVHWRRVGAEWKLHRDMLCTSLPGAA